VVRKKGPFATSNPWRNVSLHVCLWLTLVTAIIGFVMLPIVNRSNSEPIWAAICSAFGLRTAGAYSPRPVAQYASNVSWTFEAIDEVSRGDPKKGEFVSLNCATCHGDKGVNQSGWIPNLAGMRAEAVVKQLLDYKSGHRKWPVMNGIGEALSHDDILNVAAYYDSLSGIALAEGPKLWSSGRSLRATDPISRIVFVGDPSRGIAPCASCHGLGGIKRGAPLLVGQQASYIERQLQAFMQGSRANDEGEQMRVVAAKLTPKEIRELAAYLSVAHP
jgi:cytochrome c553